MTKDKLRNNNWNYGYYLVAFIDVLGQKSSFEGINNLPTEERGAEQLQEAHRQTVVFVEKLRESLKTIFDIITKETKSLIKVPEGKEKQFDEIRKAILKYTYFSDCIQAFVPLESKKYHAPCINGIFGLLGACGGVMLSSLVCNKPLRIGIDLGIATELNNGEVYGPAFFNAYELESKVAQYPRIVIGKELTNYLNTLIEKKPQLVNQEKVDIDLCCEIAKHCKGVITKDADDNYILDYLGIAFRDNFAGYMPDEARRNFSESIKKAKSFAQTERKKWGEKNDVKLTARYSLLCDYFKTKEQNFG